MQKNYSVIAIFFILIVFGAIAGVKFFSDEDVWICENDAWIKHGNPSSPAPISGCGSDPVGMKPHPNLEVWQKYATEDKIKVIGLKNDVAITSPVEIEGEARGIWYYEGNFPINIEDEEGNLLGQGIAQAQGDWMTEEFVPFHAVVTFDPKEESNGVAVFKKNNPSDLEEYDESIKIPVKFDEQAMTTIKIFFGKYSTDSSMDVCDKVYAVERKVQKTQAIGRAALDQLLIGLKEDEEKIFHTSINPGVKINSLTIENGIAKVDFDKKIEEGIGGSCRVISIRAQIAETLKQFPTVKTVIISVDGKVEDALQP